LGGEQFSHVLLSVSQLFLLSFKYFLVGMVSLDRMNEFGDNFAAFGANERAAKVMLKFEVDGLPAAIGCGVLVGFCVGREGHEK
jgi:hypothetical protein